MKRTSYLSELEFYYCYTLHAKTFTVTQGTPFFILINDYIDLFYDKHDVLEDLKPYLRLLNTPDDVEEMIDRMRSRLEQVEEMENENEELLVDEEFDEPDEEERMKLVSLRVLRWRFIKFKLERFLDYNRVIT